MALTKSELATLHDIATKVALIEQQSKSMSDTHERIKTRVEGVEHTLYRNGLNSKVDELHEWMQEQKGEHKEVRLLGMKIQSDTRLAIIQGAITLGGIVLAYVLGGK